MLKLTQTTLLTAGLIGYAAFSTAAAADRPCLDRRLQSDAIALMAVIGNKALLGDKKPSLAVVALGANDVRAAHLADDYAALLSQLAAHAPTSW